MLGRRRDARYITWQKVLCCYPEWPVFRNDVPLNIAEETDRMKKKLTMALPCMFAAGVAMAASSPLAPSTQTPEPATLGLVLTGIGIFAFRFFRKK